MRTLNLGILAHVDAGKTTLTERLLYTAGAIRHIGSVDEGTTQTDTLALERERGITIKSAVASFAVGDLAINILDTPGHPDFIAEVERVLAVLDGAVLVVSAVEGVQPQTPLLMRALQRLRVPTLLFVNKIDRLGADDRRTLEAIRRRLTPAAIPMGRATELGTQAADFRPAVHREALLVALADHDERLLRAYVEDADGIPDARLRKLLAGQTARGVVHPVFFGSAITGAGVDALAAGIAELLPPGDGDAGRPVSGRVFKVERAAAGEKVAYARLLSGTLHARERVTYGTGTEGKVTSIAVFRPGGATQRQSVKASEIAKLSGLAGVQVGDPIGEPPKLGPAQQFPPPTLESVVMAADPNHKTRLHAALVELAEQDPLINVRRDDERHEISLSLYGEVQKEVIGETLARDYGIEVGFRETTTLHVERVAGVGEADAVLRAETKTNVTGRSSPHSTNPYPATLGLRVESAPPDSGVTVRIDVEPRLIPLYIYKTPDAFAAHMDEYVRDALREGPFGWQVIDCVVTVAECGYRAPGTSAADFRRLTPLVLREALGQAGTQVCEPMAKVTIEAPTSALTAVLSLLGQVGARVEAPLADDDLFRVDAVLPVARLHELRRRLPGATGGEAVLNSNFSGYRPVAGPPAARKST